MGREVWHASELRRFEHVAYGDGASVRLRYVEPSEPGYSRRRRGRGFEYLDEAGRGLAADGSIQFSYPAKGGRRRVLRLADPDVKAVLAGLKRRRIRPELFAYRNGSGWTTVRSDDINAYIRAHSGDGYSAKDFRTWHA